MTTIAEHPVRPLEPLIAEPTSSAPTSNHVPNPCILLRFSKWLWSGRKAPPAKESATSIAAHKLSTSDDETSSDDPENAFPCRACQSWGVECDRRKPRCAHCLDQQILCFYVEPLRVTMKRSREKREVSRTRTRMEGAAAASE